ncbi:MAG: 3-methyl-2-oxobutanoate hydroxymethyltransferase [Elusimicrobia bacterium]|nr:3-methyl-2-oxobutanoate hydroxymethyltransferase [Elusimicrobiota bacterium]
MKIKKITTTALLEMKKNGEKITALTAYDAAIAKILNASQIEIVLVGDSVGNVKLGYENTISVTLEEMLHHTKAVKRGNSFSLLVTDMPYLTYQLSIEQAKVNAGRLIKEGGAEAVKLEGGLEVANTIKALGEIHIPVMGHLGLTPQSIHQIGGYKIQGTTQESKEKMVRDAKILEGAGVFAIVLEAIPEDLAQEITKKISVPTIGIGAGPGCDGQILVSDDLLGLTEGHVPKFVKQYADLKTEIYKAVRAFKNEVKTKHYPCS